MKLRNGQEIPTIREVLERFRGRCQFLVELKTKNAGLQSYDIAKELDLLDDIIFTSFHGPWLLTLKSRDKGVRIAFISQSKKQDNIKIAKNLKAEAILLEKKIASSTLIENAKSEGLDVYIWTVDRPKDIIKFIELGVNGIITNRPDIPARLIARL